MSRYDNFGRNLLKIRISSVSQDIPPLREYPQACDPRRLRSYKLVCDIERSREEQPLLELSIDPYKVRRVVVPRPRLQYAQVSRIPNARDPRGVKACKRSSIVKKCPQEWTPTLVENDEVPREEETCAVLVIDVSDWQDTATKSCYIDIIPHECNVERATLEQTEACHKLARPDDGLLMSAEEAEQRMEAGRNERVLDDSDVQECDSDGDVLPQDTSAGFDNVEDRPMLQEDERPVTISLDASLDAETVSPRRQIDDDEDEDRVIYVPEVKPVLRPMPRADDADIECFEIDEDEPVVPVKKEEPQAPPPVPNPDDADIVCIDLDSDDDDQPILPKEELQDAQVRAFDKNIQREVLDVVTLDDSDEESSMLGAMSISGEEEENSRSKFVRGHSSGRASLPVEDSEDFLEEPLNSQSSEQILKDNTTVELDAVATGEDFFEEPLSFQNCEKMIEDTSTDKLDAVVTGEDFLEDPVDSQNSEKVTEDMCTDEHDDEPDMREGETTNYCPRQNVQLSFNEIGQDLGISDCDSDSAIRTDIRDTVIGLPSADESIGDPRGVEQSTGHAKFVAAIPDTRDIADEAGSSSDRDSNAPTAMQLDTAPDKMHVSADVCDKTNEFIAHSEITEELAEREKVVSHLEDTPATVPDIRQLQEARRKKRKRVDTADAETLSRLSDDDIAISDENKNNNRYAVVERVPSPVFASPRKKKRSKKKPSENVLQLSNISTCVISKPNAGSRRPILSGYFFAFGPLYEYLKNYSATFNSINFLCKNYENVSVDEFLRIDQYVKNNNAFWQDWTDRNHGHQKENTPSNQLAITEGQNASRSDQETITAPLQNFIVAEKAEISLIETSWFAKGNNSIGSDQRRHSLPMAIIPPQNLGAKKPLITSPTNKESNNDTLKLTLKRSEDDDRAWIALLPNKTCNQMNRELPKWSCIDKEVPELDIDDFKNRPIPQKIECKLSMNLQKRPKKRTVSVDSAIASDFDEFSYKRQKLKENEPASTSNDSDHEFSFNWFTREPLEITELSKPCSLENIPKNHHINTVSSSATCSTHDQDSALCQENINSYLSDATSDSSSSFHLQMDDDSNSSFHLQIDEDPENQSNPEDCEPNIPVDYNSNHQKDSNSCHQPCNVLANTNQEERNSIKNSERIEDSNPDQNFTQRVDKVHKKIKILFGDDNIDEVKEMIAIKYQTDRIICAQRDTQSYSPKKSGLESINKHQPSINAFEGTCTKDSVFIASNFAESGLIDTTADSEEPKQYSSSKKDSNIDGMLNKFIQSKNCSKNTDRLAMPVHSPEKEMDSNESTISFVRSDLPKTVDQDGNCMDDSSSKTSIDNEHPNQVESEKTSEFKTSSPTKSQLLGIPNEEKIYLPLTHSNIGCNAGRLGHDFQDPSEQQENDEKILHDAVSDIGNSTNAEHCNINCNIEKSGHDFQDQSEQQENNEKISPDDTLEAANSINPEHSNIDCNIEKSGHDFQDQSKQQENNEKILHDAVSDVANSTNAEKCNIDCNIKRSGNNSQDTSEQQEDNEKTLPDAILDVANTTNAEHSLEGEQVLENEEHLENQEVQDTSTSSMSHELNEDSETASLSDDMEEGDFDFLASIQRNKTDHKNDDDDYDIDSDCDEYYSLTISNPKANVSEKDDQSLQIEVEQVEENLHSLLSSPQPSQQSASSVAEKPNSSDFMNTCEADDDIIIEYEKIGNLDHSKEVKPDISNINNNLNLQTCKLFGLNITDLNIHEEKSLDSQSRVEVSFSDTTSVNYTPNKPLPTSPIETPASSASNDEVPNDRILVNSATAESTTHRNGNVKFDLNNADILQKYNLFKEIVAPEDIKTESSTTYETTNEEESLLSKYLNNMLQDELGEECDIPAGTTREENLDMHAEVPSSTKFVRSHVPTNPAHSSNNYDLLKALNVNFDDQVDTIVQKTSDESSSKNVSSGVIKVKNLNDMLKKRPDPSQEKVSPNQDVSLSNLPSNSSERNQHNMPVNMFNTDYSVSNANNFQHSPYLYVISQPMPAGPVQPQVNVCNILPANYTLIAAPVNNTQIGAPTNYTLIAAPVNNTQIAAPVNNTQIAAPATNAQVAAPVNNTQIAAPVDNIQIASPVNNTQIAAPVNNTQIAAPVNNIQIASPVNNTQITAPANNPQVAAPVNNVQIPTSSPTIPENPIVTASSMFSGMFDSNGTSSFCSKTVFSLPLPPLKNIMLPPPYTLLATYDQQTISDKIERYKWLLLNKITVTLIELESMDTQIMKKHYAILYQKQTLTEETWNFQKRLLIIAQCVFSLWKLSTNNNYSSIIEAIMGTIKHQVRDQHFLKKMFQIFQKLKERGIFTSYAVERQPLTSELGDLMKQTPVGMSGSHKEVLKIQIRIYQEMCKISHCQLQKRRVQQPSNQTNDAVPVQRSLPMQQGTIPVTSPVATTRNIENSIGSVQGQGRKAHQCHSVHRNVKGFPSKCDNVDKNSIKCGKKSQIMCSKCKVTTYCSHYCQDKHWKTEHYASCDPVNS